jgi:hypothetical protein
MSVEWMGAGADLPREVLLFLIWLALLIHCSDGGDSAA